MLIFAFCPRCKTTTPFTSARNTIVDWLLATEMEGRMDFGVPKIRWKLSDPNTSFILGFAGLGFRV